MGITLGILKCSVKHSLLSRALFFCFVNVYFTCKIFSPILVIKYGSLLLSQQFSLSACQTPGCLPAPLLFLMSGGNRWKKTQNWLGRKLHFSLSHPPCSAQLACSQWMLKTYSYTPFHYLHYHVTRLVHTVLVHSDTWQCNTCMDKCVFWGFCQKLEV